MKLIIDIPAAEYNTICKDYIAVHACPFMLGNAIKNGTLIDNATNGDVIKIMFPNMQFNIVNELVWTNIDGHSTRFLVEWWNSPYQKGGTIEK